MRNGRQIRIALATAFLLVASVFAAQAAAGVSRAEDDLLRAVNGVRRARGLAPLRVDAALQRAARAHSVEMLRTGSFGHGDFGARMAAFHVRGPALGENVAYGGGPYGRARAIVAMWMHSAGHRANLLRAGFRRVGIGALVGRFAGEPTATVVTADFAGH